MVNSVAASSGFPTNASLRDKSVVQATKALENATSCHLNDEFGLFIQGILAAVAFSTLILKRLREPSSERRPVKIWFYDTSKQGVGALMIHFANIFLAGQFKGDPCTWYLINFLLDSTLGLIVIYISLQFVQVIVRVYNCDTLKFGEYGNPPQCKSWLGQCVLYLWAVILEKGTITLLVQLKFWEDVRHFILLPLKKYPKVESAVVMLIIPFFFNAFMFWVVDNFLMRKKKKLVLNKIDTKNKVKYERRTVLNGSDEEAVLLDDIADGENVTTPDDNCIYHRDTIRR